MIEVTIRTERSECGVLTCRGRWSSWPCRTAGSQSRGSSEMADPATSHTPRPLSAAAKHTKTVFHTSFISNETKEGNPCFNLIFRAVFVVYVAGFLCRKRSLQFLSDTLPAARERRQQHTVTGSQQAPWDIGPRGALPPSSCSQTFLCHESARLGERETVQKKGLVS